MFHEVRFELLGAMRGWRDGIELQLGAQQQRALLAMLLLARGRQVPLEAMLDGLWGEDIPKAATGTVRTYVSRLRRRFETHAADERDVRITSVGDGYMLEPGAFLLDVDVFRLRLAEGRAARVHGDTAKAARLMSEALTLWHGIPLSGLPGPFAESSRLHLSDLCMAALEDKLAGDVTTGEPAIAVPELRALLRRNPLHEGLAELLMLALYKSSRQAEALKVFDDMRHRLRDEVGIDPGLALREMQQRILRSDRELFGPTGTGSRGQTPRQVVRRPPGQTQRTVRLVTGRPRSRSDESLAEGQPGEVGPTAAPGFIPDPVKVRMHDADADNQPGRDLGIGVAG